MQSKLQNDILLRRDWINIFPELHQPQFSFQHKKKKIFELKSFSTHYGIY